MRTFEHGFRSKLYPDAKFVIVSRGFGPWLQSSVGRLSLDGTKLAGFVFLAKLVVSYCAYNNILSEFEKRHGDRVCHISYEELLSDRNGLLEKLCAFLAIEKEHALDYDVYLPNSSFRKMEARSHVLSHWGLVWARLVYSLFKYIPSGVFHNAVRLRHRLGFRYEMPKWVWARVTAD